MNLEFFNNPLFGIIFTIVSYNLGMYIFKKTNNFTLFNPLLLGSLIILLSLHTFNIPLSYYQSGGDMISFLLGPTTIALAFLLYTQLENLKKNFFPIIIGSLVGSSSAIISVIILSKAFGVDEILLLSFIPKSITTPLGVELSTAIGGIPAITIFSIAVAGISGNIIAPLVCKFIKHPIARGVGIGVSSHALGTARAIEIGEVEGAMSALSIVIAGIMTFILAPIFIKIFL